MSIEYTIGGNGDLFVGEDKRFRLSVTDKTGVPVNIEGWTIQFEIKKFSSHQPLIIKDAVIEGVFDLDPLVNSQAAIVDLPDSENVLTPGDYYHSWKRMDEGNETILSHGRIKFQRA